MDEALEFVTEKLPLPTTRQGQLELLRKILAKQFVESIHIELDQPVVVQWHKSIFDTPLSADPVEDISEVFARIDLVELGSWDESPARMLVDAIIALDHQSLCASFLVVTNVKDLVKIFEHDYDVPPYVLPRIPEEPYPVFAGLYVVESDIVAEGSFVVLGSPMRGYLLSQTICGVKVTPGYYA